MEKDKPWYLLIVEPHNFISTMFVQQQELNMHATFIYTVEVVDERKLDCEGACPKVNLVM